MLYWLFLAITVVAYGLYCHVGYLSNFKSTVWFIPTCLFLVILGNILWILFVRSTNNASDIFILGIIWDASITASFIIVPVLYHNISLDFTEKLGLGICLLGLFLMKGGFKLIGSLL